MDQQELIDKIASEVMKRLTTELGKKGAVPAVGDGAADPAPAQLAKYIDHTMLMPDAPDAAFDKLVEEAIEWGFFSVCVNSSRVAYVAKKVQGTDVKVSAVIGFPLGAMDSTAKAFEARRAISDGAHELDMVMNIGAMKSGDIKLVENDIRAVRRATRGTTILKVIIETSLLTDDEKVLACEISKRAGADFVKTCTGFAGGGATPHDIALMRRTVGPQMGVKASGGMRNYPRAIQIIAAGANRIGAVSSVAIVTGQEGQGGY
ncbi:MAG: deoxyribose-phosphate aldolase [Phycisphaerae bacterium]|jgi:deoxyribose-phosphate aldolase|nr:deoxyribose-phosphate aldolase [Phycisphaerae bacterium]